MLAVALFFLVLRFIAYVGWCFAGVTLGGLAGRGRRRLFLITLALCLGVFRLLVGLVVHYVIFDESKLLPFMRLRQELLLSYFTVVVPVRLMMWFVILLLTKCFVQKTATPMVAVVEQKYTWWELGLAWVIGGTVLSCLLDVPMMGLEQSFSR